MDQIKKQLEETKARRAVISNASKAVNEACNEVFHKTFYTDVIDTISDASKKLEKRLHKLDIEVLTLEKKILQARVDELEKEVANGIR